MTLEYKDQKLGDHIIAGIVVPLSKLGQTDTARQVVQVVLVILVRSGSNADLSGPSRHVARNLS